MDKSFVFSIGFAMFLVLSFIILPASGQFEDSGGLIVVVTDKPSYSNGEVIKISGQVRNIHSGVPMSVIVTDSVFNNISSISQLTVGYDKKFGTEIIAGGPMMKSDGEYKISVQYGNSLRTAETSFIYEGTPPTVRVAIEADSVIINEYQMNYVITNGTMVGVIPDSGTKSLSIFIDAIGNGELILEIPRDIADSITDEVDTDFIVLIDSQSADFLEVENTSETRTLIIQFFEDTSEIEIIGTFAVPEFGIFAFAILAIAIISIIVVTHKFPIVPITEK